MKNYLHHNLPLLRRLHNLTQPQLARKLKMNSITTIAAWEKNRSLPQKRHSTLLSKTFKIPTKTLLFKKLKLEISW